MELASKLGIKDYPCPAGGCRLTDPNFARRIKDAFEHGEATLKDVHLLRLGRHFRLESGTKVIVGRNQGENTSLVESASETDVLLEVKNIPGPITLLRKSEDRKDLMAAASICLRYSDLKKSQGRVCYWRKGGEDDRGEMEVKAMEDEEIGKCRI